MDKRTAGRPPTEPYAVPGLCNSAYGHLIPFGQEEYLEFARHRPTLEIGGVRIQLRGPNSPNAGPTEPKEFSLEKTTVWSFPDRGKWATHRGDFRGNWSPYVPRNTIARYSKPGDIVLDQMCGSGTTLVECKMLGRNAIGIDINPQAVALAQDRLAPLSTLKTDGLGDVRTYVGDARHLWDSAHDQIADNSIDLVLFHPPYAGVIRYSDGRQSGDLSGMSTEGFVHAMRLVAVECLRVLRQRKYCAVLIGDTREKGLTVPLGFKVMTQFLEVGFVLKEHVIKVQWNMRKTGQFWLPLTSRVDFLMIAHEHLFIFWKSR